MSSSGYVAQTFVAGEVPTTTIWNFLWSNDASFNTGQGFNDNILINRHFASDFQPYTLFGQTLQPFVISGGIITNPSGLNLAVSQATVCIPNGNGTNMQFVTIAPYNSTAATANHDIYFDADFATGTFIATDAGVNNSASPGLSTNRIRMGIAPAGAVTVANINQGSPAATQPVVSSIILRVSDSIGNRIYPTNPNGGLIGFRYSTASHTNVGTAAYAYPEISCPVMVPAGRTVQITGLGNFSMWGETGLANAFVVLREDGSSIGQPAVGYLNGSAGATNNFSGITKFYSSPTPGLHTYDLTISLSGNHMVTNGAWVSVKLV